MSAKKNFGLDEDSFKSLQVKVKNGDTDLFEQIFLSHFEPCMRYIINTYRASHDNAYDCVMSTLLDFRQKLVDGKIRYGNLRYLFTRMAANRYIDQHFRGRRVEEIENLDQWMEEEEYMSLDPELETFLKKAWNELGPKCQSLLRKHYYQGMRLAEIAEETGGNPATVRKQKQRCMEELRKIFERFYPL